MFGHFRKTFVKQTLKYFAINLKALLLEAIHVPEELVAQHQVRKYLKGLDLPDHYCQYDDGVSHSLNVTDIWPEQVKNL